MSIDRTRTLETSGLPSSTCGPRASLFVWSAGGVESHVLESGDSVVVGRAFDADVVISGESVSRRHARFSFDGQVVWVEDLGSRNGVRVGDALTHGRSALRDGDQVHLGAVRVDSRVLCSPPLKSPLRASTSAREQPGSTTRIFASSERTPSFVLEGQRMSELLKLVRKVAPLTSAVLVLGETGSGKEHIARALHDATGRSAAPFRAINCGALPAPLLESVLFGHLKGAFTGAEQARAGIFEEAGSGTVFLDEIGELTPSAQAALLRVLETRMVTRLGSTQETPIAARIVAATHRDLEQMVLRGEFREDLLHRLSAFVLQVPPLRERRDEIRPFARFFIAKTLAEANISYIDVDDSTFAALEAGRFPGNVRQLKNIVMRATLLCESGCLTAQDIDSTSGPLSRCGAGTEPGAPSTSVSQPEGPGPSEASSGYARRAARAQELTRVREALAKTYGHKGRAAQLLGMPDRTFRRRLRELEGRKRRDEP